MPFFDTSLAGSIVWRPMKERIECNIYLVIGTRVQRRRITIGRTAPNVGTSDLSIEAAARIAFMFPVGIIWKWLTVQ